MWTATKWAGPKGAQLAILLGVSCTSATRCVAVGTTGAQKDPHAAALSFNGSKWSLLTVPGPGAGQWSGFEDVTCPKPGHCVAIGHDGKSADTSPAASKRLAGYWNGSAWTLKAQ
jgi:hypothetical protein